MQPVNVLGVGRTDYDPKPDIAIPEMVHQAVQSALADAALTPEDIDAVVTASVDLYDGLTASNIAVTEVVGAVMKPEARVAGDGLLAACQGAMSILAGAYETVLVVAHCKASMGDGRAIGNWTFDPIYQQPLGLDDLAAAALQASVLRSPTPPPLLPPADGAAAVILSATLKTGLTRVPSPHSALHTPHLIGLGWALDEHYLGDRDLSDAPALREAARRAYAMAGIADPKTDLAFAELSVNFGYQRGLWASALDLAESQDVGPVPDSPEGTGRGYPVRGTGRTRRAADEKKSVCVYPRSSASQESSRNAPLFVAGLDCLIEIALRLRQQPGAALAHGCWGPAGQGQVVIIADS